MPPLFRAYLQQTVRLGDCQLTFRDSMRLRAFAIAYGEFRKARGNAAAQRILPDMAQRYGAVLVEREIEHER